MTLKARITRTLATEKGAEGMVAEAAEFERAAEGLVAGSEKNNPLLQVICYYYR